MESRPSGNIPRYERLANLLERRIRLGLLRPNDSLPGQRELMAKYRVSLATVRRGLEVLDRKGLVLRIPGKGVYVAPIVFKPTGDSDEAMPAVPMSAELEGLTIAVLCLGWEHGSPPARTALERVLRGAERALNTCGGTLAHFHHAPVVTDAATLQEQLREAFPSSAAALLVVTDAPSAELLTALEDSSAVNHHRPVVLTVVRGLDSAPVNLVSVNLRVALKQVVHHLRDLGHRQIGLVLDPDAACVRSTTTAWAAIKGGHESRIYTWPAAPGEAVVLKRALERALADGQTALVATSDRVAVELGRLMPPTVAIAGFGDDFAYRHLHLTTLHIPCEEMGSRAIDILRSSLYPTSSGQVANLHLAPALIVRRSTLPPADSRPGRP